MLINSVSCCFLANTDDLNSRKNMWIICPVFENVTLEEVYFSHFDLKFVIINYRSSLFKAKLSSEEL